MRNPSQKVTSTQFHIKSIFYILISWCLINIEKIERRNKRISMSETGTGIDTGTFFFLVVID
jgi:hypothetical protein